MRRIFIITLLNLSSPSVLLGRALVVLPVELEAAHGGLEDGPDPGDALAGLAMEDVGLLGVEPAVGDREGSAWAILL